MPRPALAAEQERLVADVRAALGDLVARLGGVDVPAADRETLLRSIRQLDELFLLVVVGEFNAGKSAFINALLGAAVLEEGVTPTTSQVGVLRHGAQRERRTEAPGLETITAPVEMLRDVAVVDTPGTNAVRREHEALTREFVPRSDLVLFVTSADRPFTESERAFLDAIRAWGKKVVVVVNKADLLQSPDELAQVKAFVAENALALLGSRPPLFAVSARQAARAKASGDRDALAASGFTGLEEHVEGVLDERERLRLKLLNPIGVGLRLGEIQLARTEERLELLREDILTLDDIEGQLRLFAEDLGRDFRFRLADVDNAVAEFERRGNAFFDDMLRLSRVFELVNEARVRAEFERRVVADLPATVEARVGAIVDWMVDADRRQWEGIADRLARRQAEHAERMLGRVQGPFEADRGRLLDTVRREAQRAVESYDREGEGRRLAAGVREAVAGTALLQVGALSLGTVVAMVATTSAVDVTGLMAAGALSVLGLLILPARRQRAQQELRQKVHELRERLMTAVEDQFARELERSVQRIREAIEPYTRFVRGERDRLQEARGGLRDARDRLHALRGRVESL